MCSAFARFLRKTYFKYCLYNIGSFFHCACIVYEIVSTWKIKRGLNWSRKTTAQFLKFHTRAAQICGFPREFVTLRVAQFAMKIAQLAISMERRGPLACGLLPWLWLLVVVYRRGSRTIIEAQGVFSGKRPEGMYFFEVNLMHGICKLRYVYFHVVTSEKWILVCY